MSKKSVVKKIWIELETSLKLAACKFAPENGWLVQVIFSFWVAFRPIFRGVLGLVSGSN